jgi:hypothetical protein
MYRHFVDNTIKEFQYNNEEEINRFIVAFFNDGDIMNSNDDIINYNLYICGRNLTTMKYIIRKIPCYLYYDKYIMENFERQPTYEYDTQKDLFYEEFDDMIVEFTKLIKHNINYKLHNVFTDGILDDDTYMMFYFENPNFYFGRIDNEYLIFIKEDVGSLQKEIITKKILLSCINKL